MKLRRRSRELPPPPPHSYPATAIINGKISRAPLYEPEPIPPRDVFRERVMIQFDSSPEAFRDGPGRICIMCSGHYHAHEVYKALKRIIEIDPKIRQGILDRVGPDGDILPAEWVAIGVVFWTAPKWHFVYGYRPDGWHSYNDWCAYMGAGGANKTGIAGLAQW